MPPLAAVATASALLTATTALAALQLVTEEFIDTGASGMLLSEQKYYIPAGTCSGWIPSSQVLCGKEPPLKLNVSVSDATISIIAVHQLNDATIYRGYPCAGAARVTLRRECPHNPDGNNLFVRPQPVLHLGSVSGAGSAGPKALPPAPNPRPR